jgi:hypothetical protein
MSDSTIAGQILTRIRISEACTALTGITPERGRIPAPWRDTRDRNVSIHDGKGTWFDHVEGRGGGLLDLVVRVRGGNRADALRWVADFAGVPMEDKPLSAEDRARWAAERRDIERDLPAARYWQRAALCLTEELLDSLKAALFDPMLPLPEIGEIAQVESLLASLRRKEGAALVAEYRWWFERYPGMTAGLVRAAKHREKAERRALLEYLRQTEPAARKAAA